MPLNSKRTPSKMEIPGGWGVKTKEPSVGGEVWIFSGTTHYANSNNHSGGCQTRAKKPFIDAGDV